MRVWFITGVSRGLGLALAKEALSRGDKVVGTVRAGAGPEIGDASNLKILPFNLGDAGSIEQCVHDAFSAFGRIDVIVNNAGTGLFGAVEETTYDEVKNLFNIDVLAPIAIIRTALPYLRSQGQGHIVNITSISGRAPGTGAAVYAAAKSALEGLTAAMAQEVAPFGIKVTAVAPGQFRTSFMAENSTHKTGATGSPYENTVGASLKGLENTYGAQLGDPEKGARVIYEAVDAAEPPLHLLLGSDAYTRARQKIENVLSEMTLWEAASVSTDFD